MGRTPMPIAKQNLIKKMATKMSFRKVSQKVGLSRVTVSRIVQGETGRERRRGTYFAAMRAKESKIVQEGYFNVFAKEDWLTG
jgi:hypothetical protein